MSINSNFNIIKQKHPFHLVDPSPHPVMTSFAIFQFVLGFVYYFQNLWLGLFSFFFSFLFLCSCLFSWFLDVVTESTYEGHHTKKVRHGIKLGMILFIASEVMFFFSFFWAFFHYSISPSIWIGGYWPPLGIHPLDTFGVPVFNTIILLSSGVTVTFSHISLFLSQRLFGLKSLISTIFYGLFFTFFQGYEYVSATFSINDNVFGSIFYMTTGFHGAHVCIGSIILFISFLRFLNYELNKDFHVGFECAIWYWHFVDVVWLFLFVFVYWWSSFGIKGLPV